MDRNGSAAVLAVAAGCDLVLYCADPDRALRAWEALAEAAVKDGAFAARLTGAAQAVQRTAARWPARRPDLSAWEHAREELSAASRKPPRETWD
jgi:hypothetical protein